MGRSDGRGVGVSEYTNDSAWTDLAEAIPLLAKHATGSFPFHCEHDELTVMSDPEQYTPEELARLDELGFFVDDEYGGICFKSFRYGSA